MDLYDTTTFGCCRLILKGEQDIYARAIRLLHNDRQIAFSALYSFAVYPYSVSRTFDHEPGVNLLGTYRIDTYRALAEKISLNPVLHSFQRIYHQYGFEWTWVDSFLAAQERYHLARHKQPPPVLPPFDRSYQPLVWMVLRLLAPSDADFNQLMVSTPRFADCLQAVDWLQQATAVPVSTIQPLRCRDRLGVLTRLRNDLTELWVPLHLLRRDARLALKLLIRYYTNALTGIHLNRPCGGCPGGCG